MNWLLGWLIKGFNSSYLGSNCLREHMKSSTRLDSIVFQLTPTRTRCDLVITAHGESEKIASGLLNPFLAHLRAAQEQIGKGGYSIVLEPKRGSDSIWFTKGTVERFVRFVSTPEILERVYTIESEIVQIEKAISIQNNGDTAAHFQVEDLPAKAEENIEGSKVATNGNEKALVLYQPSTHQPEEDRSTMQEKNSKVQLVQVLETRKTVLQKEQGMAFARAVAAGFDIDNIAALHSFAESFGASRMMGACNRFVDLWKAKHESGQWVDVEAMSCRSDLPSMNASGIMLLGSNEKELWPQGEAVSEKNGIPFATGAGSDGRPQAYNQEQPSLKEQIPGQFPHPMFPSWQMHSQGSGFPVFQPYPMPGMPYYQNYPGNSPFFQPPYPPLDDPILHSGQRTRQRRHSMDSRDLSAEIETQDMDASGSRRQGDADTDEEDSVRQRSRKKGSKSSRKQSGTVVIRNINYIASAKQGFSDSDPESNSDSGTDDEDRKAKADEMRKLKKKGASAEAGDDGHWQAFQNFLLKDADDSNNSARSDMFAMEGKVQGRMRQALIADAASMLGRCNMGGNEDADFSELHDLEGNMTCLRKPIAEQMLDCGKEAQSADGRTDRQLIDVGGQRCAYRRSADANIDSMINRQEKLTDLWDSSLDPAITNGFRVSSNNNNRGTALDIADESVVILHKSRSLDQVGGDGRTSMDMDYEVPSALQGAENHTVRHRSRSNFEPDDLNLMPDRVEHGSSGYDPALDYEIQAQVNDASKLGGKKKEVMTDAKGGPKKGVKEQKLKTEKRIIAVTKREKPSKLSPSEDARARAEKLRAFKADLQKLKKEKEEEQIKRLAALRLERQKRIAARSGANPPQSPLPSQQARKQLSKLSPVSQKGSKFSDTEPGSSSPLQRSTLKTFSKVSSDSIKASRRLNDGSHASGNQLTRSASSLSVRKEENNVTTPQSKATIARIRRLSEPKGTVHQMSSGKIQSAQAVSRRRASVGPETKRMSITANLDKTKSGTPQELKLRASKISPASTQKKSTKEIAQKPNGKMISGAHPGGSLSRTNVNISSPIEGDDNTVVEKTVVILECEKPSIPVVHASEDKVSVQIVQSDPYNPGGKSEDDIAIPHPASPVIVKEVDQESFEGHANAKPNTHWNERGRTYVEEESPNTTHIGATEEPYQAPYARISSVDDPCMSKSDYGKAPPTSSETGTVYVETTTVYVSDDQNAELVKISEGASAKHQGKEPSKGFRRLLKFGKKSSAASESNVESDKASLDVSGAEKDASNGSSNEVFILKNLLTQEEGSTAGTTPKKSSRSFSLLSPFRKTSEKKLTS